jgi:glyoxylase-like metal-dependent hydrolase (beta-lactamase superfamily II)
MTLDGTNTWLLGDPSSESVLVVDPGPAIQRHLFAVVDAATADGRRVAEVLLTHGHPDHAEGARQLADLVGAPVRALDPVFRLGDEGLAGGDVVAAAGLEVRVVATPGHTADSLSFLVADDGSLVTGDTVLGRGTSVVAYPDGRLRDYLRSLEDLRGLAATGAVTSVLPGHGPPLDDPLTVVEGYLAHRQERLAQVEAAVAAGARTPAQVVEVVYADVDPALWPAAELSVRAQLEYLTDEGARGSG